MNSDIIFMKTLVRKSVVTFVEFAENVGHNTAEEFFATTFAKLQGSTFKSFLFYFSGHGSRRDNIDYICPVDYNSEGSIEKSFILNAFSNLLEFANEPKIFLFDC